MSPLRQYCGIAIQRQEKKYFGGGTAADDADAMAMLSRHLTETERRSARAAQYYRDLKATEFVAKLRGSAMKGRIDGMNDDGMFVRIEEISITGFMPWKNGPRRDRYPVVARDGDGVGRTRAYALNDVVEIRLEEANPLSGKITFAFYAKPPLDRAAQKPGHSAHSTPPPLAAIS